MYIEAMHNGKMYKCSKQCIKVRNIVSIYILYKPCVKAKIYIISSGPKPCITKPCIIVNNSKSHKKTILFIYFIVHNFQLISSIQL